MRSFLALIRREQIEHRGAFLYAPLALLGLGVIILLAGYFGGRARVDVITNLPSLLSFFQIGFGVVMLVWWAYLLAALFFYFADAFNADRRSNAMLFWKSMPVSDFTMLLAKFAAGMTLFPLIILGAALVNGVMAYLATLSAGTIATFATPLTFSQGLASYIQIGLAGLAYYALGLLWYAPFFAWVGLLSTLAGRWSIPMAFLVPAVLAVFENVLVPGSAATPWGGYVWSFFYNRLQFGFDQLQFLNLAMGPTTFDAAGFVTLLLAQINWTQMAIGWAFALLAIYAASQYRRRIIAS